MDEEKKKAITSLQSLRNIGPVTAEALYSIGIKTPKQFRQSHPEELYEELKKRRGGKLDKCVLYQLRGALLDIPWPKCKDVK
jgi:nucleotidyltransferase/DNA polymerase involved in DNA repair